ncbi:MAG: hypothetical protein LUO93_09455, partial [Methanomicrobiales archaeon]|nr:hypothetical protein [Methanomicrobiales archaeon]
MTLRRLRRRGSPVGLVTLVVFLNATLCPAWARIAYAAEGERATYNETSRAALAEHVASKTQAAPAQATATPASNDPAALAGVDKALAELPSGGGSVSPQATALPSGAATQLGMGESFTMQLSTGTAGYSLPLTLVPARGRVQPRLDINYSSGGGFGLAGVGWSIGAAAIYRQTDRGLPTYDDQAAWHPQQDRFAFGGMELVPICLVTGGACTGARPRELMPTWAEGWQYFRTRVEGGFLRFFWSPDHRTWRIQGKDGTNMELGVPLDGTGDEGALERDPEAPSHIYRWYVARQYDSQLSSSSPQQPVNTIVYRYASDGNTNYLTDIFDTSPAAAPTTTNIASFAHHTRINYEVRPDIAHSCRAGYPAEVRWRVSGVDVTSKPFSGGTGVARELVRRYHLSF